jgi:DNA invertase Pin-like site-specific DNA recombinase
MKVVAYLRVSTDRQADEGYGLVVQRRLIRDWARANGHTIVRWAEDEGKSGTLTAGEDRPGLRIAFVWLRRRKAEGIVVARLDRLARDLILQETLLREIWGMGGKAWSCSAAESQYLEDDPGDPARKLIRQVLGAVFEYERAMIVQRLKNGRAQKAADGGYAYGAPRYGWAAHDGELVPVAGEQEQITLIRELRDAGSSLQQIADILNNRGVPGKRGGQWWPSTVATALRAA